MVLGKGMVKAVVKATVKGKGKVRLMQPQQKVETGCWSVCPHGLWV